MTQGTPRAQLMYLSPELGHPAIARQIASLIHVGFNVSIAGFSRTGRFQDIWIPRARRVVRLGNVSNLSYGKRLVALLGSVFRLAHQRRVVQSQDYLFATSLDLAILAVLLRWLTRARAQFVYQVLDIRAILQRTGVIARILRLAERLVLSQADLMIVSSPAFVAHYFTPLQGYRGRWVLLENKLLCADNLAQRPTPALAVRKAEMRAMRHRAWTVGWFGTLRCSKSLRLLCQLADNLGESINIHIAGVPLEIGEKHLQDAISGRENIVFFGRYRSPDDLMKLYSDIDFIWCIDLTSGASADDCNPLWVLQNRLYEGGYFAVPALAAQGTASGEKVDRSQLGWSFREPLEEELRAFLSGLSRADYLSKVRRIAESPSELYCDNGRDIAEIFSSCFAERRMVVPENREHSRQDSEV